MMMQSNAVKVLGSAVMLTTCFRKSIEPVYARHFHRFCSSIPVRHDPYTTQAALTGGHLLRHLSSTKFQIFTHWPIVVSIFATVRAGGIRWRPLWQIEPRDIAIVVH
jgi:hypothetical protein